MERTDMFDGLADDYSLSRPDYAEAFLIFLRDLYKYGLSEVCTAEHDLSEINAADIGSGTGKFSKQLLDKGFKVYGIEPNDDMRKTAENNLKEYKSFISVRGSAANTSLKDKSVDFIATAQAFHWFNALEFRTECLRIIKPGGKVFLIWNIRSMEAELNKRSYDIFKQFCPRFKGFSGGMQEDDSRIHLFFQDQYKKLRFDHPIHYTMETFIGRSLSASYSLREKDTGYKEYIAMHEKLFDQYAENGILKVPNETIVYYGSIK